MNRQERRAQEQNPFYHFQLAEQLKTQGNLDKAVSEYQHAIRLKPNFLEAYCNLGNALKSLGQLKKAVNAYEKAIQLSPQSFELYLNLSATLQHLRDIPSALKACEKALELNPHEANAYFSLSNLLLELGDLDRALEACEHTLALDENFPKGYYNKGLVYLAKNDFQKAEQYFLKVIELEPNNFSTWMNLSDIYAVSGYYKKAEVVTQKALDINFNSHEAHYRMGMLLKKCSKNIEAVPHFRTAIHLAPGISSYWYHLHTCLIGLEFAEIDELMQQDLIRMLDLNFLDPMNLLGPIYSGLEHDKNFIKARGSIFNHLDDWAHLEHLFDKGDLDPFFSNPLFIKTMQIVVVTGQIYEQIFRCLRHLFLRYAQKGEFHKLSTAKVQSFLNALALQCFFNEYVYSYSAQEESYINRELKPLVESKLLKDQTLTSEMIALLGCYLPLHQLDHAEKLLNNKFSVDFQFLLTQQIKNPLEEAKIKTHISVLTPISEGVSQAVQNQYEENPYPRWMGCAINPENTSPINHFKGIYKGLENYPFNFSDPMQVLIAGCGTGKQSLQSNSLFRTIEMTAVDLSRTSLSYAIRKTNEMGVTNIKYTQADILKLKDVLEPKFDLIECGGVLHHLGDPMEGWQVLVDLLKPQGFMRIGLYSELARQHIVYARNYIKKNKFKDTASDIRRFRDLAFNEPTGSPLWKATVNGDFYTTSACRDLLFHVQEHRFTIPQIKKCLQKLGLEFITFDFRSNHWPDKYSEWFPEDSNRSNIDNWHVLENENPDMFIEMYQFLVYKK